MKILERMVDSLIRQLVSIDNSQFGFVQGRGTTDAIFVVRQLQEKYLTANKRLYMAFVDLEKAFDRVPRKVIWWVLRKLDVEEWIVRLVQGRARENRKNSQSGPKLRILDRFQTPQNANKSVQQVCALNPIFPQPTNFHESIMSKKSQTFKSSQTDNVRAPFKCDIMVVKRL